MREQVRSSQSPILLELASVTARFRLLPGLPFRLGTLRWAFVSLRAAGNIPVTVAPPVFQSCHPAKSHAPEQRALALPRICTRAGLAASRSCVRAPCRCRGPCLNIICWFGARDCRRRQLRALTRTPPPLDCMLRRLLWLLPLRTKGYQILARNQFRFMPPTNPLLWDSVTPQRLIPLFAGLRLRWSQPQPSYPLWPSAALLPPK